MLPSSLQLVGLGGEEMRLRLSYGRIATVGGLSATLRRLSLLAASISDRTVLNMFQNTLRIWPSGRFSLYEREERR